MDDAEGNNGKYGTLYVCATPIGNMGDITLRALETLKNADYVAAEDTRRALKLLNRYELKKKLISCHEHNEQTRRGEIIALLKKGFSVALISDAGTPAISDPGGKVVAACIEEGISVTSCPGACAAVSALVLSGLPSARFVFEGFLPMKAKERKAVLESLKAETRTVVLYEAPHRLKKTLAELYGYLGDRRIAVLREMTKIHEEAVRATISEATRIFEERVDIKGELVLVIEGSSEIPEVEAFWEKITVSQHVEYYVNSGLTEKEAIKKTAKDRKVPKKDIYESVKICKT